MRPARVAIGAALLVVVGGGVALAVQQSDSACERYKAAAERTDYASFEQEQTAQAQALAECMAEEARGNP